jgi:Xaa-Pro aminopeptidase
MDTNLELKALKELIKNHKAHALLLRSTDKYFNEYVPQDQSPRAYISRFNGSVGDALITPEHAYLFVDGRYELQAQAQAPDFNIHVCKNNISIENSWLNFLSENLKPGSTLLYDPSTIDMALEEKLQHLCEPLHIKLVPEAKNLIHTIFKAPPLSSTIPEIWQVGPEITGLSTAEKLEKVAQKIKSQNVDAFLAVKLDDIAWLLNCRGNAFPFQQTFPSLACITPEAIILGLPSSYKLPKDLGANIKVVQEYELIQSLSNYKLRTVGLDPTESSKEHEIALRAMGIEIKSMGNPLALLKAIKNDQELLHMRSAFKKADHVIHKTQNLIHASYEADQPLSETEIDDIIRREFTNSKACELSFRPICAGAKNGAIIHYGTPNSEQKVKAGSLFLLDTGAYYQGGYATDLTRTFLLGPKNTLSTPWQKEMFTLVLKASIKGMSARFRRGFLGLQLDALVREPLWRAGLDYAHGTGHGVGINVHEFPPRIAPTSLSEILEHQVFSIEPGLYFENVGGVRIENLVTVVADPKLPQFLRVLPLTFCPFDERLIDDTMLDNFERDFLNYFQEQWLSDAPMPQLPPLRDRKF